jgi:proteasome lid subunit RPN8/RPN11
MWLMRDEECWILVGRVRPRDGVCHARAATHSVGHPTRVEADAAWALRREERRGDVVGFLHTHPMGGLRPSARDVRTMRAWCDAFGKPLFCVIRTPSAVAAWRFVNHRSRGKRIRRVRVRGCLVTIGGMCHAGKVSS